MPSSFRRMSDRQEQSQPKIPSSIHRLFSLRSLMQDRLQDNQQAEQ